MPFWSNQIVICVACSRLYNYHNRSITFYRDTCKTSTVTWCHVRNARFPASVLPEVLERSFGALRDPGRLSTVPHWPLPPTVGPSIGGSQEPAQTNAEDAVAGPGIFCHYVALAGLSEPCLAALPEVILTPQLVVVPLAAAYRALAAAPGVRPDRPIQQHQ